MSPGWPLRRRPGPGEMESVAERGGTGPSGSPGTPPSRYLFLELASSPDRLGSASSVLWPRRRQAGCWEGSTQRAMRSRATGRADRALRPAPPPLPSPPRPSPPLPAGKPRPSEGPRVRPGPAAVALRAVLASGGLFRRAALPPRASAAAAGGGSRWLQQ